MCRGGGEVRHAHTLHPGNSFCLTSPDLPEVSCAPLEQRNRPKGRVQFADGRDVSAGLPLLARQPQVRHHQSVGTRRGFAPALPDRYLAEPFLPARRCLCKVTLVSSVPAPALAVLLALGAKAAEEDDMEVASLASSDCDDPPVAAPGVQPDLTDESRSTEVSAAGAADSGRLEEVMASFLNGDGNAVIADLLEEGVQERCAASVFVIPNENGGPPRKFAISPAMSYAARGALLADMNAVEFACLISVVQLRDRPAGNRGRTPIRGLPTEPPVRHYAPCLPVLTPAPPCSAQNPQACMPRHHTTFGVRVRVGVTVQVEDDNHAH